MRDFELSQDGIITDVSQKKILKDQIVMSATGSVVNMENDIRRHTSEVYVSAISGTYDNSPFVSTDAYAELIVSRFT